jgi:hypothetical protein
MRRFGGNIFAMRRDFSGRISNESDEMRRFGGNIFAMRRDFSGRISNDPLLYLARGF